MLYYIVNPEDDVCFKRFVGYVKSAYWPEGSYKKLEIVQLLPKWEDPPLEHQRIKEINEARIGMVRKVCVDGAGLYTVTNGGKGAKSKKPSNMKLPFMDWYHKLFLQRQYDYPYRDPQRDSDSILSLEKDPKGKRNENHSKNLGNFNHFVNVVMATARIIGYFRNPSHIANLFNAIEKPQAEMLEDLFSTLSYKETPSMRTFKLMLAAFYHDIGKTIVEHRHGMEGSFIIADHTTRSLSHLDAITKQYNNGNYTWEREDLIETSNFLYYHDSFGTFGTGESSYTLLTEIIDRIKRGSLKHLGEPNKEITCCNSTLFDLWVLNIADIIVSVKNKFKFQAFWQDDNIPIKVIESFFKSEGGLNRIHDLQVAMSLLQKHNAETHKDETRELEKMAQQESRAHTVERIKRLVSSSLSAATFQFLNEKKDYFGSKIKLEVIDGFLETNVEMVELDGLLQTNGNLSVPNMILAPGVIQNIIFRSIQSLNDPKEFYERLALIVSMDYALGFFTKLAHRAIEAIDTELSTGKCVTGWIRSKNTSSEEEPAADYVLNANALFFVDNYCATVVKILAHLLFRERSIDQLSNIEFEDARNRLIDEKIDKIIGMEGPYRQNKSIELILKSVFVY